MSLFRHRYAVLSLMAILCGLGGSRASAQLVANGGFEDNGGAGFSTFNHWTVLDEFGSPDGFLVQTGSGSPVFGNLVPEPPEGSYAAMTDAGGAGAHILYQDFVVPVSFSGASLSFARFINNQAGDFVTPDSLDYSGDENQQARADILLASADPFSVAGGDVLLNLFQTQAGDPLTSGYTTNTTDLTSLFQNYRGQTLRLRFAEVDNLSTLNFGIDAVSLTITAVPEPGTLGLLIGLSISGLGLSAFRLRRRSGV